MTINHFYLAISVFISMVITAELAQTPEENWSSICSSERAGKNRKRAQKQIAVAPSVRVSQANSSKPHWEVQIAADPTDSKRLIACSIILNNDSMDDVHTYLRPFPTNIVVYTSMDGGQSWQLSYELDKHQHNVDPSCAFGPDGSGYFMSFGGDVYGLVSWSHINRHDSKLDKTLPSDAFFRMPMYRSMDGAKTWGEAGDADTVDREYITIDDTTRESRGRIYVHGVSSVPGIDGAPRNRLVLFRSNDRGQTYKSVELADEGTQYLLGNGNGVVMSDGTFAAIFGDLLDQNMLSIGELQPIAPNAKLKFISSSNGGQSFTKANIISDWYLRYNGTMNDVPSLAVDRTEGPFRDRLYAAWVDARSRRGQIRFSSSDNKGKTWLPSFVVSDNWATDERGEAPDAFMPALAVNRNGVLGVMWYDRRDHPDNLGYDIRFSASLDGGESFLSSVLVARGGGSALDMKEVLLQGPWLASAAVGGRAHGGFNWFKVVDNGGDTAGLTCDRDGIFHPLWIERASGVSQVSTTRIAVGGHAMLNGGSGLELLRDLSSRAEVRYSMAHLDLATNEVTVGAAIVNTSNEPLAGSLTLRLLALSSNSGPAEALNADNSLVAGGATWEFHSATGTLLEPGALTVPRQLRFKLRYRPLPPLPISSNFDRQLVEMDTKIIGK